MRGDKSLFRCSRCGAETRAWHGSKTVRACPNTSCAGVTRRVRMMDVARDAKAKAELAQFYGETSR
jgi:hypothetical protein